jgi:hypothetical protein
VKTRERLGIEPLSREWGRHRRRAQVLTEIEIGDAIQLATTSNFPTLVRLLRMAQLEVAQLRRPELKDKA